MKPLFILLTLSAGSLSLMAQTKYVVTDLGTPAGYTYSSAASINNAGQVAGQVTTASFVTRGFRTSANSPLNPATDLIPLLGGGASNGASSINNSGQVAGTAVNSTSHNHAFRYDADGTLNDLGSLSAIEYSVGNAINDSGQVTGASDVTTFCGFTSPAFRTAPNSAIASTDSLGTLFANNCKSSDGYGINSAGGVVGYGSQGVFANPEQHAIYAPPSGPMVDLGILGGTPTAFVAQGKHATAFSINISGQIVGESTYTGSPSVGETHAFKATTGGGMTTVGTLGGTFSSASGINAAGDFVGYSGTTGDAAVHAFLYTGGVMQDLNDMIPAGSGWVLVSASAINDNGQIAATGWLNGVQFVGHALRLDPLSQAVPILITSLSSPTLGLTSGQVSSLTDKLNNALASIQGGLNKQAVNQLNAFINAIQTQVKVGKMSIGTGNMLIAAANAIIAAL
jgi:probable HAF family extracellular repeat protein